MDRAELTEGTLFDIQGFSVHDGPGCRTLIFMKGCSLHCFWCSNPEGIYPHPVPMWNFSKCNHDLKCVGACRNAAIHEVDGHLRFDREKCMHCTTHDCVGACFSGALKIAGFRISVEEVFRRISRDRQYWGPDGGITLTGGEPFVQAEFTAHLLERCYKAHIHTAIETCGFAPWTSILKSLPYLDWIFFDLKHLDPIKHGQLTDLKTNDKTHDHQTMIALENNGNTTSPHQLILSNARKLAAEFTGKLIFRMPLVPGFNDDAENVLATITFLRESGKSEINILPLHHLGREKYQLLDQQYFTTDLSIPAKNRLTEIQNQFEMAGINCYIGSQTPF
jgi:glycyl-radical enzyme activating protein